MAKLPAVNVRANETAPAALVIVPLFRITEATVSANPFMSNTAPDPDTVNTEVLGITPDAPKRRVLLAPTVVPPSYVLLAVSTVIELLPPSQLSEPPLVPEMTPFQVSGVVETWLKPPPLGPRTIPRLASKLTFAVEERILPTFKVIWSADPGTMPIRVSPAKLSVPPLQIHLPAKLVCEVPGDRMPVPTLVTTPLAGAKNAFRISVPLPVSTDKAPPENVNGFAEP